MINLEFEVSREDLQQLSAMLDGEISDESLDRMLERMANEPALRQAWTRFSQIQAAAHRHAQVSFDIDLSDSVAAKLSGAELGKVTKTSSETASIVPFPQVQVSPKAMEETLLEQPTQIKPAQQRVLLDLAPYNGVDRRRVIAEQATKKKGFRQQLLAHLAVAASVASVTVWVQNSFITGPDLVDAAVAPVTMQVEPPANNGVPSVLMNPQGLPMATVGNVSLLSPVQHGQESSTASVEPAVEAHLGDKSKDVPHIEKP